MNKHIVIRFAAPAALVATGMIGCKPAAPPASLSSVAPPANRQAARLAGRAARALAARDAIKAVRFAEAAVALDPQDPAGRIVLGRAYIAAGRFVSAEAALTDALTLSPGDGRAEMNLALTRIALGKWDAALAMLAAAKGKVSEADRGLALALAGDKAGGVLALEGAARAEGAGVTARQNLALVYALSGRWTEARAIAAQDLTPDRLRARMTEWALLSQPKDAWDQVAALLHVTPVEDGGMPVALALGTPASGQALAMAGPAPDASFVAPVATPQTEVAEAVPAPSVPPGAAALPIGIGPVRQAGFAPPPLIAAPATRERLASTTAIKPARRSVSGRYVVQLGAFSSAANVETAWRRTVRRMANVAAFAPSRTRFGTQKAGTVYRLSLAGFETHDAAMTLCRRIRAAEGDCFVRAVAGDPRARLAATTPAGQALL